MRLQGRWSQMSSALWRGIKAISLQLSTDARGNFSWLLRKKLCLLWSPWMIEKERELKRKWDLISFRKGKEGRVGKALYCEIVLQTRLFQDGISSTKCRLTAFFQNLHPLRNEDRNILYADLQQKPPVFRREKFTTTFRCSATFSWRLQVYLIIQIPLCGAKDDVLTNWGSCNRRLQDLFILPRTELDHVVPTGWISFCLSCDLITLLES